MLNTAEIYKKMKMIIKMMINEKLSLAIRSGVLFAVISVKSLPCNVPKNNFRFYSVSHLTEKYNTIYSPSYTAIADILKSEDKDNNTKQLEIENKLREY